MGHDAAVTKKRVLTAVGDCVAAINEQAAATIALEAKHNALCEDLDVRQDRALTRDKATVERLDAHGAWCLTNEKGLKRVEADHDRRLRALALALPPLGLWARLRWLLVGPPAPLQPGPAERLSQTLSQTPSRPSPSLQGSPQA